MNKYKTPSEKEARRIRDRYIQAIIEGDESVASEAIAEAAELGWGALSIYLDVLAPSLIEIGEKWHAGEITVGHEHQATQLTLQQLAVVRARFMSKDRNGKRAVVCGVEGDGHFVGAQFVADFLVFDGWTVDFLGAGVPASDLAELVAQRRPDLVAVSLTVPAGKPAVAEYIRLVRSAPGAPKVVIGGQLVDREPEWASSCGADAVVHSLPETMSVVRNMFNLEGSSLPLETLLARVGRKVKQIRNNRGWSQQQLADAAGLDRAYLSTLENGKQNLTLGVMKKLADALDSSLDELITE